MGKGSVTMNQGGNYEILIKKKKSYRRQRRNKKRFPKRWSENYLGKNSAASSGWTVYYKMSSYLVTFLSNLTICTMFSFTSLKREKKKKKIIKNFARAPLQKKNFVLYSFTHSSSVSYQVCAGGPNSYMILSRSFKVQVVGLF